MASDSVPTRCSAIAATAYATRGPNHGIAAPTAMTATPAIAVTSVAFEHTRLKLSSQTVASANDSRAAGEALAAPPVGESVEEGVRGGVVRLSGVPDRPGHGAEQHQGHPRPICQQRRQMQGPVHLGAQDLVELIFCLGRDKSPKLLADFRRRSPLISHQTHLTGRKVSGLYNITI